jgi:O-antigen ligase
MLKFARIGLTMGLVAAALILVLRQTDGGALARSIAELPTAVILCMMALMVAGAFLASMRLAAIAADVGHPLHFREAVAALSIGQLAGSLFFQLVGQLVARSALLGRHGLPVSATVVMTAYERLIALAVSLTLAFAGGWYIFGRLALDLKAGGAEFSKLAITALAVLIAGAAFVWGKALMAAMAPRFGAHVAYRLSRTATLSTATQLCTMAAYVIGANALEPVIPLADVAAASAVVMLAASLPISLAGWGVREVSAVLALGAIGMPAEEAFVVAAAVGIVSMVAVALLSACTASSWRGSANANPGDGAGSAMSIDYGAFLSWILPIGAATAVFFQVYAPTGQGGRININFADPAAIIGGSLFVVWAIRDRQWPSWRLPGFNAHVLAATAAVAVAFLIGWAYFGVTDWALTNRLLGWFVLLGYGATGALIATRAGNGGYETLLRTLVLSGAVVAGVDIVLLVLKLSGLNLGLVGSRICGFAMNPNAFAFQLCMCFAAALIVFRERTLPWVLAVILTALWCTGSRAGFGTILVLALAAIVLRPRLRYPVATAAVIAACATLILSNLPLILSWIAPDGVFVHSPKLKIESAFTGTSEISNAERLMTLEGGLRLFLAHPIFGAGLGAFVSDYFQESGKVQVIHSTPLWLLAEFGVVGTAIMMLPIVRAFLREWSLRRVGSDIGFVLILVILGFVVMSSVHELMYQRMFWLLLGAGMAMMGVEMLRDGRSEDGPRSRNLPPQQE